MIRPSKHLILATVASMGIFSLVIAMGCSGSGNNESGNKNNAAAEQNGIDTVRFNVAEESMRNAEQYYWPESDSIVKANPNKTYTCADVSKIPTYEFGEDSLYRFIQSKIKYPRKAKEKGISGRVTVRFKVDKNGRSSNFSVARGKSPELDKEALRVVRLIPRLEPAMMGRHKVAVWYNMPIKFNLPPDTTKTK